MSLLLLFGGGEPTTDAGTRGQYGGKFGGGGGSKTLGRTGAPARKVETRRRRLDVEREREEAELGRIYDRALGIVDELEEATAAPTAPQQVAAQARAPTPPKPVDFASYRRDLELIRDKADLIEARRLLAELEESLALRDEEEAIALIAAMI